MDNTTKIGDYLWIPYRRPLNADTWKIVAIARATKTQWICSEGTRIRKNTFDVVGSPYSKAHIVTPNNLAYIKVYTVWDESLNTVGEALQNIRKCSISMAPGPLQPMRGICDKDSERLNDITRALVELMDKMNRRV